MASDAVAGDEWEQHVDEDSKVTYYYNTRTGESSWEAPEGFNPPAEQEQPPKWQKFVDDDSGATYYYDQVSGTSRWDKPEDFEEEEEISQEEEKQETPDQKDEPQRPTEQEEESSDDKEQAEGGEAASASSSSTAVAAAQWVKYLDATSGKPYYHNASTGTTQWEHPQDFDELATPAGSQVSAEYQAHLNRVHTERLARVTQQVLDPSGNLCKLNSLLSNIDGSAGKEAAVDAGGESEGSRAPKAEWQQHIDAQTQRYYYHNVVTGVTQWTKPDAPVVSGLADWIPPEVLDAETSEPRQKPVSGVNYVAKAKFNRLTGKYEQLGGDEYWQNAGRATDRAGRQMSAFFDMNELEKNREEAQRKKERLKRSHIDWKKISKEKKAKKQKQRNEWLFND